MPLTTRQYIVWYIVDGRVPGVIVFLWLWIFIAFYGVVKFPRLVVVFILSLVTAVSALNHPVTPSIILTGLSQVLIIGYELQVKKLGIRISESNGQPAYPTYELAPYRLATVTGGLFVAFIVRDSQHESDCRGSDADTCIVDSLPLSRRRVHRASKGPGPPIAYSN